MTNNGVFHDDYISAWNEAIIAGAVAPLEPFLAPDYHGWVGHAADRVEPFTTADAYEGFAQAIAALQGSVVHADHRTVARRGDHEAIVFYELSYRTGDRVLARAALLESWRHSDGEWKLHRDVTEHSVQFNDE
jgi:hypothetical protein